MPVASRGTCLGLAQQFSSLPFLLPLYWHEGTACELFREASHWSWQPIPSSRWTHGSRGHISSLGSSCPRMPFTEVVEHRRATWKKFQSVRAPDHTTHQQD